MNISRVLIVINQTKGHAKQTAAALKEKGVAFSKYDFLEQDKLGIWSAPSGAKVAWFKDPDGNLLSISQH